MKKKGISMKNKKIVISLGLVIIASVSLFLGLTARKIIIFREMKENSSQYENNNNYYEKVSNTSGISIEYFCKENKSKKIIINDKNGIKQITNYSNGEKANTYIIQSNGKKVAILDTNKLEKPNILGFQFEGNFWYWLKMAIMSNIKKNELNGKECYYINGSYLKETYVEKETGLILKMQDGVIDNEPVIYEYYYEFGNVVDNDFIEPDISEYEIQEYNMSSQKEPIEIIENTTVQGVVELNHNGYIYTFNGQHFGEYGFEMPEYTSLNIDNTKQTCIDYYTSEKYDTSYIEEGDIIICTGDLKKYFIRAGDFNTKDNPIIVLKSKDYNEMKKETLNNKKTATVTVGEYFNTVIYIKYNINDKQYNLPFVLKFNITDDTQIIGNLEDGKKINVQYKDLNVPLDEIELKSIEVID